jgi:SOS-response transcriptional repressor LexA
MKTANLPAYSSISLHETRRLAKVKASGCAVLTYQVLCGFSRVGRFYAFPSQRTIAKALGGAYSLRAIQKALTFLEKHGIIKRTGKKNRRSKTVQLIVRKARHVAEVLCGTNERSQPETGKPEVRSSNPLGCTPPTPNNRSSMKRTRERTISNRGKNKSSLPVWRTQGNYGAFERSNKQEQDPKDKWFEAMAAHFIRPDLWEAPAKPQNPSEVWEWVKGKNISFLKIELNDLRAMVF